MSWQATAVSRDGSHHVDERGDALYDERFDGVLKFHSPGLASVFRGELAWHIHTTGLPAYSRRFARTFGFYEGLAAVVDVDDGGWHHTLADGCDLYPERHAWCGNFQSSRCPVRGEDGTYHHIDTDGRQAYAARWSYAGDYRDGCAVVQATDGYATHVDPHGVLTHGRWFVDLDVFHKGLARARDEGGWMHIDDRGRPAYARRFAAVEPFYNGQARVERFDGGLEVVDEHATPLVFLRQALP